MADFRSVAGRVILQLIIAVYKFCLTDTEPGFKGDTATGATKPATVETGATIAVPLFVSQGDKVKIDTRTGEYLSRV